MHRETRRILFGSFIAVLAIIAMPAAFAGAWGHDSFENDSALDWVENEFKPRGISATESAIARVTTHKGYMDVDLGAASIAAAETLAAARGNPGPGVPPDVLALAKRMPAKRVEAQLIPARAALDRVLTDPASELRGLWADSPDFAQWKKSVEDLKARLR